MGVPTPKCVDVLMSNKQITVDQLVVLLMELSVRNGAIGILDGILVLALKITTFVATQMASTRERGVS